MAWCLCHRRDAVTSLIYESYKERFAEALREVLHTLGIDATGLIIPETKTLPLRDEISRGWCEHQ